MANEKRPERVRYAVLGLGYFAQNAVLPAFKRARRSELVALVSGDPEKRAILKQRYRVPIAIDYGEYDALLSSGKIDAVYVVLPNSEHADATIRAARAGVHVLCEKPMATTEDECLRMIRACEEADVRLMIAYRLHFERTNLEAIELVRSGKLGEPRIFDSVFAMQVREGNSRTLDELGGGPLNDIGVYCVNAARYVFRSEPTEVMALSGARNGDARFSEIDEHVAAMLRFPGDRIATFVASFGSSEVACFEIVGTTGALRVDPAYSHASNLRYELMSGGKPKTKRTFRKRDQIAPVIGYFSDCVLQRKTPEPSGFEGLADVRILRAIEESARRGERVLLEPLPKSEYPDLSQEDHAPAHGKPRLVNSQEPSG
jgi:glucose-fructose oxidoreductase